MQQNIFLRVIAWLDKNFERYTGMLFAFVMFTCLFLQVLFRYVFRYPLPWTEEIAVICFVMSIYFGAVVAIQRNQHIKIEIFTSMLSDRGKLVVRIIGDCLFILFCVVIIRPLTALVAQLIKTHAVTSVTRIPKYIYYCALPLCFGLNIVRLIEDIVSTVREILHPGKEAAE
jgi:TRAP-type C4-dicarboxylate transport system permease small subunit